MRTVLALAVVEAPVSAVVEGFLRIARLFREGVGDNESRQDARKERRPCVFGFPRRKAEAVVELGDARVRVLEQARLVDVFVEGFRVRLAYALDEAVLLGAEGREDCLLYADLRWCDL